ncbi:MAG: hypothetical protein OSA95_02440, partial [Opitutales bacterium]|nr:hypothetical protein [Opitutales bacterium]
LFQAYSYSMERLLLGPRVFDLQILHPRIFLKVNENLCYTFRRSSNCSIDSLFGQKDCPYQVKPLAGIE